MSNPYQSSSSYIPPNPQQVVLSMVRAPAVALIVVSTIAILFGVMGLAMDVFMIASGMADRLDQMKQGGLSEYTTIAIRSIWGLFLLIAAGFVLFGAIKMHSLRNYSTARAAAIVAMIPLLGPCCLLGIPFGIWALVILLKPEVKNAFHS